MDELSTLALNAIFGYLSIKERIKCKSVCVRWQNEIELREKNNDTLILHFSKFHFNKKWSNDRSLMGYENSFKIKSFEFLKHQLTKSYFKSIKRLSIEYD